MPEAVDRAAPPIKEDPVEKLRGAIAVKLLSRIEDVFFSPLCCSIFRHSIRSSGEVKRLSESDVGLMGTLLEPME